jgi:hypothetical protein
MEGMYENKDLEPCKPFTGLALPHDKQKITMDNGRETNTQTPSGIFQSLSETLDLVVCRFELGYQHKSEEQSEDKQSFGACSETL